VAVTAPPELRAAWERLISRHPFPVDAPANAAGTAAAGSVLLVFGTPAGSRIVEHSTLVPVIRMWEVPPALTRALAESGSMRLLELESVTLPDIALPVDGLYPGDDGYPLSRPVSAVVRGDDPGLRQWFDSLPDPPREDTPGRLTWIGAVGDIMPARGGDEALLAPAGPQRVFSDTLPLLRSLDLLVGNLEAAATVGGTRLKKTYTFRFDPRALGGLAAAGFSYLSAANNHTFDYGKAGFEDTLRNLAKQGISTSGAGSTLQEAERPAILHARGTEVRVLSFSAYPVDRTGFDGRSMARAADDRPGSLWLDAEGIGAAARAFSPEAFNIALVHGGVEWSTSPSAEQKEGYRALVRAGADLVIGSHPHVLQGLEALDGGLIAYSLGNFLFPGMDGTKGGENSMILQIGIHGQRIVSLRFAPVRLNGATVRRDPGQASLAQFRLLTRSLNAP
jgi:poly-gamma-glutamate capsule biosynthesis protein CapA/YwtB (metallophosphatase superfamily)